jgi:hypothetical protein
MPSLPTQTLAAAGHTALHNDAEAKLAGIAGADLAFSTGDVDTDGALTANSDSKVPSQKATKSYIDSNINSVNTSITYVKSVTKTVSRGTDGDYLCDGTDDEVQIQQAVDAVNALGGGVVHLKPGTYTCGNTSNFSSGGSTYYYCIRLYDSVTLEGEGFSTVITQKDGLNASMLIVTHPALDATKTENVCVRDMKIYGNYDNQSYADDGEFASSGIVVTSNNSNFCNLSFDETGMYGAIVVYGYNNRFNNINIINTRKKASSQYGCGIFVTTASSINNTFDNIYMEEVDSYGIQFEDFASDNNVSNFSIKGCFSGLIYGDGNGNSAVNVYIDGATACGVYSGAGSKLTNFKIYDSLLGISSAGTVNELSTFSNGEVINCDSGVLTNGNSGHSTFSNVSVNDTAGTKSMLVGFSIYSSYDSFNSCRAFAKNNPFFVCFIFFSYICAVKCTRFE